MLTRQTIKITPFVVMSSLVFSNTAFAEEEVEPAALPITVNGGTVQFQGSIVNAPCVIENDSASAVVNLGQYRVDSFSGSGSTSSPVAFDIGLTDCSVDTYSKAAITFNGITVDGNNKALALTATQAADTVAGGVGVQILQDNTPLVVDGTTPSALKPFTEAGVRLGFQAQYLALAEKVTPGSGNTSANFTITYE